MAIVLVVEDDPMNRDMIRRRLQWEGFDILLARTGAECITEAHTNHPDLILMDIALPGMDGREVATMLKANPKTAGIPIIAVTAFALPDDRRACLEAGCDEHEAKPLDFHRLLHKIAALLIPNDQLQSKAFGQA